MLYVSRRACLMSALVFSLCLALPALAAEPDAQRIARILAQTPLIDGHNDLPWEIRSRFASDLGKVDLSRATEGLPAPAGSPARRPG